jgi:Putative motility protein
MDVTSIARASTSIPQNSVQATAQTKMLRNSMDDQTQVAQNLLQSLPQSQSVISPSYLGRNIDVKF